ncbi:MULTISPECIES: hypothetical protein [Rhodococcus]|uniref:hypothetical protein n=1 Tax=Rhodococcus TaxID=1827 RepID=UPI001E510650|nr:MULTISPECIES: hypothetical protein [Rhodococcus]
MSMPATPPTRRPCRPSVPVRPARGPSARVIACRTTIPFGRDNDGTPVSWDLSAGRHLLIRRDERRSSPSVSLDLIAMTTLTGGTHDLVVVDPHRRHRWLGGSASLPTGPCCWATTADQITGVVAELDSPVVGPPRVLLVADLAATVAALDDEGRTRLARVAADAREHQLLLVATTADTNPRWYPEGLIDAFDDIVARRHEERPSFGLR